MDDMHRVFDTGYFSLCKPVAEETRDGIKLTLEVGGWLSVWLGAWLVFFGLALGDAAELLLGPACSGVDMLPALLTASLS
jgi:hypothetical protein